METAQPRARQLKDELQQRPTDGEAKTLLDMVNHGVPPPPASAPVVAGNALLPPSNQLHLPMERIKRNYDEASYRQIEMEIHNFTEARLATMLTGRNSAAYHVERGKELLAKNMTTRRKTNSALRSAPTAAMQWRTRSWRCCWKRRATCRAARTEAQTSVRLKPNVDGLFVLARLDLKQNQVQSAAGEVNRALALEPGNAAGLALKRDIAARQTGSQ